MTKKRVEAALLLFNRTMGTTSENEFFLQGAYGGWQLMRKIPGTTSADSITTGFRSKREIFDILRYMDIAVISYKDGEEIKKYQETSATLFDSPASA